jgi:hypothetical protein
MLLWSAMNYASFENFYIFLSFKELLYSVMAWDSGAVAPSTAGV